MSELKPLNTSEKRQSNIELLRIIIMFIVVTSHFSVHGGFTFSTDVILGNKLWTQYIRTFVKICMSVLVLISGYFLVDSKKLKVSKVLKMWLQIFTYSIVIFLIYVATGAAPFSIKALAARIFPINSNQWWFASSYFVMYLLHPFINRFLHSLDKASYQKFIVLGVVCWSVIPTILINKFQSNDLIWFILVYCIGGYLKLHFDITKISSKKAFLIFFILHALTFSSVILFDLIGTKIPTFGGNRHALYFFGMQKLPALLM
ncbi:MAG: acyltransferase family protein, partial [Clostridia bacterium]|nr:acyltransferase family protein [Clostridia bacterium]